MHASVSTDVTVARSWNGLVHAIAVILAAYLPLDALRLFGLASRGCRRVAVEEERRRPAVAIPSFDKLSEFPPVLQLLYADFARHIHDTIPVSLAPRNPVRLPGMTLEESSGVDRAAVVFPNVHMACWRDPTVASGLRRCELRLDWVASEALHSDSGRFGACVAVADVRDSPLAFLAYSGFVHTYGTGVTSLDLRLLICRSRNRAIDVSWRLAAARDAVRMSDDSVSLEIDTYVASLPQFFTNLVVFDSSVVASAPPIPAELQNVKLESPGVSVVAPLLAIAPFQDIPTNQHDPLPLHHLPQRAVSPPLIACLQLMRLMTAHRFAIHGRRSNTVDHVCDCIRTDYLVGIERSVAAISRTLYKKRELLSVLTTPKGLWNVATGYAELTTVDHLPLWRDRAGALASGLRRQWDRGLSELWDQALVPMAFIASATLGR